MIRISDKALCCGCTACAQACPKQCIALHADKEGFLYPQVDMESCVDCGRCERVCPELRQNEERKPAQVYAARHPDETVRRESSSGGIFTLLADMVIDMGGWFSAHGSMIAGTSSTTILKRAAAWTHSGVPNTYRAGLETLTGRPGNSWNPAGR